MLSKSRFGLLAFASGFLIVIGFFLEWGDYLPFWAYAALLVCCFPVFTLSLGLWWMAREHEEDIPFVGY